MPAPDRGGQFELGEVLGLELEGVLQLPEGRQAGQAFPVPEQPPVLT
jgi:hypothetical protein